MKVLVIGAGLIGGSVGLALKHAGHQVEIRDQVGISTQQAQESTQIFGSVDAPDVIVVAVPTTVTAQVVIESLRQYPQATVIDVASIKSEVVSQVEANLGKVVNFVATHPMSGKEKSGAANASFDLFVDRIWVVTPSSYTAQKSLDAVTKVIEDCGGIVVQLTPEQHDKTVALTSHLPQILSSLLAHHVNSLESESVKVSGGGLRDMTRLAASNAELWNGILSSNAEFISPLIERFSDSLNELGRAIETKNDKAINEFLLSGNAGRKKVPGKHGAPAIEYSVVSILIDDKPGQLAGIFQSAGNANINIEDVRIDHSLGKAQAVIELFVQPVSAQALKSALSKDGWVVRTTIDSE